MEAVFYVVWGMISCCFWAAILSFIPTTLYLLFINPQISESRFNRQIGIYVLNEEAAQVRREKNQARGVFVIYAACYIVAFVSFFLNWGLSVEIFSTGAIILFVFAFIFYVPVIIYIILRNPWQHHVHGLCLNAMHIVYGVCLLIFSGIFVFNWMNAHGFLVSLSDMLGTVVFVFISSIAVSYLPILVYIFICEVKRHRLPKIFHPNILFIIYIVCFFICAAICFYSLMLRDVGTDARNSKNTLRWLIGNA